MTNKESKQVKSLPPLAKTSLKIVTMAIVPVLCIVALVGGLIVGYAYIGDKEAADVFKWETWEHVYNLVFSEKGDL